MSRRRCFSCGLKFDARDVCPKAHILKVFELSCVCADLPSSVPSAQPIVWRRNSSSSLNLRNTPRCCSAALHEEERGGCVSCVSELRVFVNSPPSCAFSPNLSISSNPPPPLPLPRLSALVGSRRAWRLCNGRRLARGVHKLFSAAFHNVELSYVFMCVCVCACVYVPVGGRGSSGISLTYSCWIVDPDFLEVAGGWISGSGGGSSFCVNIGYGNDDR